MDRFGHVKDDTRPGRPAGLGAPERSVDLVVLRLLDRARHEKWTPSIVRVRRQFLRFSARHSLGFVRRPDRSYFNHYRVGYPFSAARERAMPGVTPETTACFLWLTWGQSETHEKPSDRARSSPALKGARQYPNQPTLCRPRQEISSAPPKRSCKADIFFQNLLRRGLVDYCMRAMAGPLIKSLGSRGVLVVIRQEKLDGDETRRVLWYSTGWQWAYP